MSNEQEPVAKLTLPNGETFEAKRETASLYTFMGALAIYNHIYCYEVKENEVEQAFYIFDFVGGYKELQEYMRENEYPMHLNMPQISKSDTDAYERAVLADLNKTDGVPEGWA